MTYQEWRNQHAFRIPQQALIDLDALMAQREAPSAQPEALNPATCVVDGVTYAAKEQNGCAGCAAYNEIRVCDAIGNDACCDTEDRPDGKSVIWVREQS